VEVDGHREDHAEFGGEGDEEGFAGPEEGAEEPGRKVGEARGEEVGGEVGEHAGVDAELRDAWGDGGVGADYVEVAKGAEARGDEALAEGDGEGGDGEDDHECHLEAGLEEGARIEDEDGECGRAESVERGDLAIEPAGDEVDGGHDEGALGGDAEAGELGVREGGGDGEEDCEALREAEAAEEPEEASGEQRDVKAGDDEEVEGSGALEGFAEGAGEVGAVAEEHGVEHGGVFWREADGGGEMADGRGGGEGLEAVGGPGLCGEDAAAEGGACVAFGLRRGAEDLYARGFGAAGGADAVFEEVVGVGPGAGIAVDVGGAEAERDVDKIAAVEGEGRTVDGEADATGGGLHDGEVGG